eukprot:TRINITY_DN11525_c0_g1_i2.p1 TRINITY_DN11525_c0_g1~~TRINITY_DN11525_c0_g1_i2.p1  ORF type:complete len:378 (+),score=60.80 TRINITY_DN11525_c0_g1_i2:94-1227(+)
MPLPDQEEARTHFSRFGEVADVYRPPANPDICYITFKNQTDLEMAILESKTLLGGVPVNVQQAVPRNVAKQQAAAPAMGGGMGAMGGGMGAMAPMGGGGAMGLGVTAGGSLGTNARVYVNGLPEGGIDDEVLRTYFSQFGTVKDVYTPLSKNTGQRSNFSFVTMTLDDEANAIVSAGQHQVIPGIIVSTTIAAPRVVDGRPGASAIVGGGCAGGGYVGSGGGCPGGGYGGGCGGCGGCCGGCGGCGGLNVVGINPATFNGGGAMVGGCGGGPNLALGPAQGVSGDYRVFVQGMPAGLNADMLRGHFARHGEIADIYIPPAKQDIAYISFSSPYEVEDAILNSGLRIAGFWVQGVKRAEAKRSKGAPGQQNAIGYSPY